MILQGKTKNFLKGIIRYYVETTNKAYDDFITSIQKNKGQISEKMEYSEWLAIKCFELLKSKDISLADCIENKDTIRAAISADESRQDGEFYTPEVWCKEGRKYLKNMLGDLYGEAYIWDASCGTGNLLKTSEYPRDKVFMSTLLEEDVKMVESVLPGVTSFKCDFVNGIDIDENNLGFSNKLPEKLIEVLRSNKPIVIFMNPPYKVMESTSSDVGRYMGDPCGPLGDAKCALDIFHQFMYRILMIKRFYKLTNVFLGIYGPVTMFHSNMLKPLYNDFKKDFVFVDGMCFAAGDFANTSESVGWIVGYTAWKTKSINDIDTSVVLDAKTADLDGNVTLLGKRVIKGVDENLHDWTKPDYLELSNKTGVQSNDFIDLPQVTNMFNMTGRFTKVHRAYLGSMMSSNFAIRATRRASISTLPMVDGQDITEENFWRCVGSYVSRRCYASMSNAFNNCQYCSKPDETIKGYKEWLINGLPIFLFDFNTQVASYRGLNLNDVLNTKLDVPNKFFPIDASTARTVMEDDNLIADLANHKHSNEFIVKVIEDNKDLMCTESMELMTFAITEILESLSGDKRKKVEYSNHTMSWDASLIQIRSVKDLWSEEKEQRLGYLLSKLKSKLKEGVYNYGFMMDTSIPGDVNVDSEFGLDDFESDNEGVF